MLHVYPRQEAEIWAGVLERVDHVVWHIRAFARLGVHPSAPQSINVNVFRKVNFGGHART